MEARKSAKLLAWLIALAVVFTMTLPSSVVWAAEGDAVASIGDETYTTVQDAVDNAKAGEVIVMQSDVGCATINVSDAEKKITLDLNGKTIRNNSTNDVIVVRNGAELTVEDNSIAKDYVYSEENYPEYTGGKLISKGNGAISVVGNIDDATWNETSIHSKVTVNGGALIGQEGALFAQGNGAEITLNDGYAEGLDNAVIAGNGTQKNGIGINGGTTINVNGGVMIGNIETSGYISCGIYHPQSGVLNITGGTIVSKEGLGILMRNGALNLQSCNIEARGAEDLAGWVGDKKTTPGADGIVIDYSDDAYNSNNTPTDTRKVNISGGTIKSEKQKALTVVEDDSQKTTDISITGGTFSTNPGKYIADGYLADKTEDGYQIIKEGDATENVALAGKTYYPTLKEAIDAAEAGDTVTLLKDITVDMGDKDAAAIAIKKDLTLDGNGKTIAANKSGAEEGMGHILGIQGANVKVRDLTIDGTDKSARHAIQVYGKGSNATLYSVTVKNCFGYGLVVNGATATATRLTTDGNGWGGVNVTKGVNITDNPSFTLNSGTLTDENPIQIDVDVKAGDLDADWVTFGEGAGEWDIITDAETGDGRPAIQWKPAKGEAVAQVNGSNYATLEAAIKAAKEGATVKLLKDIEFSVDRETDKNTSLIEINKDLTLDGNGRTITVKGNVTEGKGHVIGILDGANVTVTDLTIDGGKAARHGIQTYINGSKATLQNVTVKNCLGYGVVANGSTIIADELYTSGNAWGGVNVSKGSGVKEEPKFVFNGGKLKAEVEGTAPIQIDNVDTTEPINENWVQFGENEEGNWHYEKIGETKIHWLEGAPIESITLNTESIKLEVGDKAQLIATVLPENAYNKDVAWSVPEGTKAIEVDADTGVVTALEKAVAVEVTATAKNGKTATCQVSVNEDADETTTLTVQPSVTDTTMNADDIVTAINNADDADEILVDVPNGTNNVISKDVFAAAKERKAGKLIIKTENATFTFDADQIENAADVNVGITTVPKEKVDVDEWLPGATTEAIELTHDGNFPAPATITYTLTDITGVDTVYLYYYNDGALELMAQDALTVADNSVTFTLAHASAYVFSTEPIEATTVANDIEKAIEAIGTVTYGDETKAAIKKAREQYDLFAKLYPEDTDKVGNLDTLTAAEAAYKALDDEVQAFKAEFDAFYDKVKDGGVMSYEEQQQVPKLRAAFEALDDSQKKALEAYEQDLQTVEDICKASQEGEVVSQANRVSKAVAEKLPTNVAFTTAVKSQIDAVRALYDSVVAETPDAKVLLTSELAAIEKAEAAYKTAKRAAYSSAKISLSTTKYTYNGKAKRPTVKGLSAFVNGTDYTIAYKSNVKSGKATVTVTGKGDCAGLSAKTATFRIVPNKAAISKLTKGKRNMKVRIKSQKKAAVSGYQIAYKYGKSGKYKKVTTTKLTKKIRKLKTKKYYYVKVRAYKKIDGKKYYGTYSKIKKIKVR